MTVHFWSAHVDQLNELHELCGEKQVGYSIHYEESANTFYVSIESAAPAESTVTKSWNNLQFALGDAIEHVKNL